MTGRDDIPGVTVAGRVGRYIGRLNGVEIYLDGLFQDRHTGPGLFLGRSSFSRSTESGKMGLVIGQETQKGSQIVTNRCHTILWGT